MEKQDQIPVSDTTHDDKKAYAPPELCVHGTVEALTQMNIRAPSDGLGSTT